MKRTNLQFMTLAVVSLLSGQMLSFADDSAASGATAIQEPEGYQETTVGEPETGTEEILSADGDPEASDDTENGSEGEFEPESRPADTDPA